MKKILLFILILISMVDILPATTTYTLPAWFKKHKIYNTTEYPIMVRASFAGYDSPSPFFKAISGANSVGLLIEPKSNSNSSTTKFFEIGNYGNDEDNSFTAIGIFKQNQPYIAFSEPIIINPTKEKEKDYTISIKPGIAPNVSQFILEEKK